MGEAATTDVRRNAIRPAGGIEVSGKKRRLPTIIGRGGRGRVGDQGFYPILRKEVDY